MRLRIVDIFLSEMTRSNIYRISQNKAIIKIKFMISPYHIENVFLKYTALYDGFDALDLDLMYGTRVIDDTLYICSSDGKAIQVGNEEVDPEFALDNYTPDELHAYMEDVTDKILVSHTTANDFDKDLLKENLNDAAIEALQDFVDFPKLIEDYNEIWG